MTIGGEVVVWDELAVFMSRRAGGVAAGAPEAAAGLPSRGNDDLRFG